MPKDNDCRRFPHSAGPHHLGHDDDDRERLCPRCNAIVVILHGLNQQLPFIKDWRDEFGGSITCDLGPLQIHFAGQRIDFAGGVLLIEFLDADVYSEVSADLYTLQPGPWMATLVTLREELDARFGRLQAPFGERLQ